MAVTTIEYAVPFVSPVIEQVRGFVSTPTVVEHDAPPGVAVAVYPVMGDPPSEEGAVHEVTADALPRIAETADGADGATAGVTALLVATADDPAAF